MTSFGRHFKKNMVTITAREQVLAKKFELTANRLEVLKDSEAFKLLTKMYQSYISETDMSAFPQFLIEIDGVLVKFMSDPSVSKDPKNKAKDVDEEDEEDEEDDDSSEDDEDDEGDEEDEVKPKVNKKTKVSSEKKPYVKTSANPKIDKGYRLDQVDDEDEN